MLRGIFREEVDMWRKAGALRQDGMNVYAFADNAPNGRELFFVAARHDVERAPRASIPHERTPAWDAVRIGTEVFRRVERSAKRAGHGFSWYKPLEEERLRDCVNRWHWQGTHQEVAADIVSKTIQTHPFPNANHRVSILLGRVYLDTVGIRWPRYSLRGRGARRFHRDTRGFVEQSKYILHIIRHQAVVRIAFEEGYMSVQLKNGSVVEIREADLEASRSDLRSKHIRSTGRMIQQLAAEDTLELLARENKIGLSKWVAQQ